jgi:dihydrofolate reductase
VLLDEALGAESLLLGRRSDEWFAARWLSRNGEWADRLNSMPKYVVSSTLQEPRWGNATVLSGDAVDEVSKLKRELDGDIVVYASTQLARTLIEHDLVDELRLIVYPVVLGTGERLFGETSGRKPMRLVHAGAIAKPVRPGLAHGRPPPARTRLRPRVPAGPACQNGTSEVQRPRSKPLMLPGLPAAEECGGILHRGPSCPHVRLRPQLAGRSPDGSGSKRPDPGRCEPGVHIAVTRDAHWCYLSCSY